MNKNLLLLLTFGFCLSALFSSCAKDTEIDDPYANWKERNDLYLDSIVNVARNVPEGETWKIIKNYKYDLTEPATFYEYDSVYVKYLPAPAEGIMVGDAKPLFTDSVDVYYQGFLINGYRFDGNFTGNLDLEVHNTTRFGVADALPGLAPGIINGWSTALQELHEHEYVELYLPYQRAYGSTGSGSIPGNSVLKFQLYIEKIIHPKGPDDYSLKSRTIKDK